MRNYRDDESVYLMAFQSGSLCSPQCDVQVRTEVSSSPRGEYRAHAYEGHALLVGFNPSQRGEVERLLEDRGYHTIDKLRDDGLARSVQNDDPIIGHQTYELVLINAGTNFSNLAALASSLQRHGRPTTYIVGELPNHWLVDEARLSRLPVVTSDELATYVKPSAALESRISYQTSPSPVCLEPTSLLVA